MRAAEKKRLFSVLRLARDAGPSERMEREKRGEKTNPSSLPESRRHDLSLFRACDCLCVHSVSLAGSTTDLQIQIRCSGDHGKDHKITRTGVQLDERVSELYACCCCVCEIAISHVVRDSSSRGPTLTLALFSRSQLIPRPHPASRSSEQEIEDEGERRRGQRNRCDNSSREGKGGEVLVVAFLLAL